MSRCASWIAIKGGVEGIVLPTMGLSRDDFSRSKPSACTFGGWFIVRQTRRGYECSLTGKEMAEVLSREAPVLRWGVEEHVMCSYAEAWEGGRLVWSVTYNGEDGIASVVQSGALPAGWPDVLGVIVKKQEDEVGGSAGVDHLFEAPESIVEWVAGYRDAGFETGTWFGVRQPSLFSRLFGKRRNDV